MQLAIVAAGFTPGEAGRLCRFLAAWKRQRLGRLQGPPGPRHAGARLQAGVEAIFRQIEGFGEYSFPESHSASFALLVYISAWIKCTSQRPFWRRC